MKRNWKESYNVDVESGNEAGNRLHKKCDCIGILKHVIKMTLQLPPNRFPEEIFCYFYTFSNVQRYSDTHIIKLEYIFFQIEKLCECIEIECHNSEQNSWKNKQTAACNFMTICRFIATHPSVRKCMQCYSERCYRYYVCYMFDGNVSVSFTARHTHCHRRQWQREHRLNELYKRVKIIS